MPYTLKGRNVLITGGSRGLGAYIARKFAAEGCNVAINYVSRREPADELAKELESNHSIKTLVIQGDGGNVADIEKCVQETLKVFGGLDVVIGNAGWTRFSNFADLHALSDEEWDKCWNVNVKGNLALLRAAMPTFEKNPDGGAFIITSSVAGTSIGGSSMAYSVTKAAQLHLMKCLAQTQGPKVRVNAVLPGLLLTEWGMKYTDEMRKAIIEKATLKQETDLNDCADAFVMIAKNGSMTGQRVAVDAGINVASMG